MQIFVMIQTALQRMDYLLVYTFVQFMKRVIHRFFVNADMLYIALGVAVFTYCMIQIRQFAGKYANGLLLSPPDTAASVQWTALHRVSCLLLVDIIMGGLRTVKTSDTDRYQSFMMFLVATASVILIPSLTSRFENTVTGEQIARLVFVMYAENSSYLTQDVEIDRVIPLLAIILISSMKYYCKTTMGLVSLKILHAVNMLLTSMLINTLFAEDVFTSADGEGRIAWMISTLVFADRLQLVFPYLQDIRDFAIWKSARLITLRLILHNVASSMINMCPLLVLFVFNVLGNLSKGYGYEFKTVAITDLCVLVVVNNLFEMAKSYLLCIPHSLVFMFLLSLLCAMQIILDVLRSS